MKTKAEQAYDSYVAMCNRLGQAALPFNRWAGLESGGTCNREKVPFIEPKNKFAS